MACVTISPFHSGLLVTGDTFAVKDILKSFGGRWDPEQRGWSLHRVDPEALRAALRSSKDVGRIKDQGLVDLQLSHGPQGLVVAGQTYPVRTLLASEGGVWDAGLGGWRFCGSGEVAAAKLTERLQQSGRVGRIIQQQGKDGSLSTKSTAATTPDQRRGKVVGAVDQAAEKGSCQKHHCSNAGTMVSAGGAAAKRVGPLTMSKPQASEEVAVRPRQGGKMAETTKREQRLCISPGGSRRRTITESSSRRISGKQRPRETSGSVRSQQDLQSVTVTKRKKVEETKDKVIETATITVKRVRCKKTS